MGGGWYEEVLLGYLLVVLEGSRIVLWGIARLC